MSAEPREPANVWPPREAPRTPASSPLPKQTWGGDPAGHERVSPEERPVDPADVGGRAGRPGDRASSALVAAAFATLALLVLLVAMATWDGAEPTPTLVPSPDSEIEEDDS